MNKNQEDKLTMYRVLLQFLLDNISAFASVSKIGTYIDKFKEQISKIDLESQRQSTSSTGTTKSKEESKYDVAIFANEAAQALSAYYADQEDAINEEKYERISVYLVSDSTRDTQVKTVIQPIIDQATLKIADLAPHGYLPSDLAEFKEALTNYENLIGAPRNIINASSEATDQLAFFFRETDLLLEKKLSRTMTSAFKRKNPTLFSQFERAYTIVNSATRTKPDPDTDPKK